MSDRIDLHIHSSSERDEGFQWTVTNLLNRLKSSQAEFQVSVNRKLDDILTRLVNLKSQGTDMATTIQDIEQFVVDIDTETNGIAARLDRQMATIEALKAQIAAGSPVTQEQLEALGSSLTPISARLKQLGADPADPLPVDPPVEERG